MKLEAITGKAARAVRRARADWSGRGDHLFRHGRRNVAIEGIFVPEIEPAKTDIDHSERLVAAYRKAAADAPRQSSGEDIWYHVKDLQSDFFHLLRGEDIPALARYLCNMSRHSATHGTIQGLAEYRHLKRSAAYRKHIARLIKERMLCLAEAIGARPIENPEQGEWGHSFATPTVELAQAIDRALGIDTSPPPIDGGLFKVAAGDRSYGERDCGAIYTAWLLRQSTKGSAAEIGGGGGRLAYWAKRLGIEKYTIYDLPHIGVLQGFYLLKAGLKVSLYGEPDGDLCIRPDFAFPSARRYDVVINQDLFPEIDAGIVKAYLRNIAKTADRFISINHESRPMSHGAFRQQSVPELVGEVGGFELLSRQLFWLRPGYACETYGTV